MLTVAQVEARKLKPFTQYYYQWAYRPSGRGTPVFSRIGRTKTLPRANDDIRRIRLGHFGCSNVVRNQLQPSHQCQPEVAAA
jgi:alkaline phosphatase D